MPEIIQVNEDSELVAAVPNAKPGDWYEIERLKDSGRIWLEPLTAHDLQDEKAQISLQTKGYVAAVLVREHRKYGA